MSIDVTLTIPGKMQEISAKIYIRESGGNREITRDEWDERFPGREPYICQQGPDEDVFDYNITHNLTTMAGKAGIYEALWRPEEIGITLAGQLIEPLTKGLENLQSMPDYYKQFNPENGWSDYEGLVKFVAAYLAACKESPEAEIRVSR